MCALFKARLSINLQKNTHSTLTAPKHKLQERIFTSASNLRLNTSNTSKKSAEGKEEWKGSNILEQSQL